MAFRQPTHLPPRPQQQPLHETSIHPQSLQINTSTSSPQDAQTQAQEEDQWILFSAADSSTNRTYTATATTATRRTAGRSRVSDYGSLDTAARSYDLDQSIDEQEDEDIAIEEEEEEDGELDSLDSHLLEFRDEGSLYRQRTQADAGGERSGTVLPTHDGFGSFRLDRPAIGEDVQQHLYAFEQFNPRKVKRRRESLEIGQLELETGRRLEVGEESERDNEREKLRRIENWRMEQSRLLVEEIQKESRRRRMSVETTERRKGVTITTERDREQEDIATLSTIGGNDAGDVVSDEENQSFWNRVTRRVIRDLMGIDDDLLSIIFGETLPEDDDLSSTPLARETTTTSLVRAAQYDESTWEHKLLERIARELGILVNQISDHPGAFNTYLKIQQEPLPYAGMPIIPESSKPQLHAGLQASTPLDAVFRPTLQSHTQTQPVTIPQASTTSLNTHQIDEDATPRQHGHAITREEWEADLDISLVFSYLRNRFTSKFRSSLDSNASPAMRGTSHLATSSTADTAARAARVRQHHPLITHQTQTHRKPANRQTWKVSIPDPQGSMSKGRVGFRERERRGSSSCASERGKERVRSGSSRHYWDFGRESVGSVRSGSLVGAAGGGMGSWGEV
jgi:hypothetical protein